MHDVTPIRKRAATSRSVVVLVVSLMLLTACSRPEPSATCVALLDVSASVSSVERTHYLAQLGSFVESCSRDRAWLHVDLVTGHSMAGAHVPISMDLAGSEQLDNPLYDEAAARANAHDALEAADALVASAPSASSGTDLLGGFVVAARRFQEGAATTSRLVIFTDGIHTAAPFNLTATELDDEAISELLDAIAEADLIASLDDVEVTFVGVNMGETSLAPQRLRGIERFWRAYVDASGAKMAGYDTTLPAARR